MDTWPSVLPDREVLVAFAHELAEHARELVLPHFRRPMSISYKVDASPVTDVDRRVEQALRRQILARFPTHGVIGEEFGSAQKEGAPCWIIDPIDGTKAFVTGRPLFGTLVGLLVDAVPVLGVLEAPALGERWLGARGLASEINGTRCTASAVSTLAQAKLSATTIDMFKGAERRAFDALGEAVQFRTFGGDCHAYGALASGFVDLVVEAGLQSYDYLPLVPIVAGAGGVMTDWLGQPLTPGVERRASRRSRQPRTSPARVRVAATRTRRMNQAAEKHLLIVYHTQSGSTQAMAEAVIRGVRHPEVSGIELRIASAFDAGVDDLLWAEALIFGTPENFGYMSGALKDFFDRTFYPTQGKVEGLPFAVFIKGGNDGSGALSAIRRIAKGYPLREVQPPIVCRGALTEETLARCEELGTLMAAGLELGMY